PCLTTFLSRVARLRPPPPLPPANHSSSPGNVPKPFSAEESPLKICNKLLSSFAINLFYENSKQPIGCRPGYSPGGYHGPLRHSWPDDHQLSWHGQDAAFFRRPSAVVEQCHRRRRSGRRG